MTLPEQEEPLQPDPSIATFFSPTKNVIYTAAYRIAMKCGGTVGNLIEMREQVRWAMREQIMILAEEAKQEASNLLVSSPDMSKEMLDFSEWIAFRAQRIELQKVEA